MIYACVLCGYEYDPKYGDPDSGIAEEPEFDDAGRLVCLALRRVEGVT